jgi:hypothetical protein
METLVANLPLSVWFLPRTSPSNQTHSSRILFGKYGFCFTKKKNNTMPQKGGRGQKGGRYRRQWPLGEVCRNEDRTPPRTARSCASPMPVANMTRGGGGLHPHLDRLRFPNHSSTHSAPHSGCLSPASENPEFSENRFGSDMSLTHQVEMSCSKEEAPKNVKSMSLTLDVSQVLISWLKPCA